MRRDPRKRGGRGAAAETFVLLSSQSLQSSCLAFRVGQVVVFSDYGVRETCFYVPIRELIALQCITSDMKISTKLPPYNDSAVLCCSCKVYEVQGKDHACRELLP